MLTRMRDHPVSTGQVNTLEVLFKDQGFILPYLSQPVIHGTLLGLFDSKLQPLRLAGAFRVGGRIADGTVGSCIHFIHGELVSQR